MSEPRKASPKPYVAALVLVRTREPIAGQHEHAAIVTGVDENDVICAFVMPAEGAPYPVQRVAPLSSPALVLGWAWPRKP